MINKNAILKQYASFIDADGLFLKTLDDLVDTEAYFETNVSDFLTPDLIYCFQQIASKYADELLCESLGGFNGAERARLIFRTEYSEPVLPHNTVGLLEITYNTKFNKIEHKDVLGALMAMGIKREKIGDIVIAEKNAQVLVSKELEDYICMHLDQVGRASISIRQIPLDQALERAIETQEMMTTVKSLRLDAIIAAGYNLSRSETQKLIESERVKVNHQICSKTDYQIDQNDMISVRGFGRMILNAIEGTTKKDRIRVILSLYKR